MLRLEIFSGGEGDGLFSGAGFGRPGPIGLDARDAAPGAANIVHVFFKPPESTDEILAASQHLYIDLDSDGPEGMMHLLTDTSGTIVDSLQSGTPVLLDDFRVYHVLVSAAALLAAPSVSQGVPLQANSGKMTVPAHIAVLVTSDGKAPISGLACTLSVGSNTTNLSTSNQGWVVSADRSSGAVTIEAAGKATKIATDPTPAATLAIVPTSPARGAKAKISITPPSGAFGFKVTDWSYDISHTNPGMSVSTATVTRPTSESASTFDREWEGILCASGKANAKFTQGATVRASGDAAVKATVTALDPLNASPLNVSVSRRTGFEAKLTLKPEKSFSKALDGLFLNLGEHAWQPSALPQGQSPVELSLEIGLGPNKGCVFVTTAKLGFSSEPQINALLTNPASGFSKAQDKAYLIAVNNINLPTPKIIPRSLYDITPPNKSNTGGAIVFKDATLGAAQSALGLKPTDSISFGSGHCMPQTDLLDQTRKHEFAGPSDRSHRGNCQKALRALDPGVFAEALVQTPGPKLDFSALITARAALVASANDSPNAGHNVVDEPGSLKAQDLVFTRETIPGVNQDDQGQKIGNVWDPVKNVIMT
jgi:hypothetical protein